MYEHVIVEIHFVLVNKKLIFLHLKVFHLKPSLPLLNNI